MTRPRALMCGISVAGLVLALPGIEVGCSGATTTLGPASGCGAAVTSPCDASIDAPLGADGSVPSDTGAPTDGGGGQSIDAGSDSAPKGCPSGPGPSMVEIAVPDASAFCVDTTEVTNAQYAKFLSGVGNTGGQSALCTANNSFTPGTSQSCPATLYDPDTRADYPVACVTWCDAVAYCAWAGKQLCADTSGQPIDLTQPLTDMPAWLLACTNGRSTEYTYGNSYVTGACNDDAYDRSKPGLITVGSDKGCRGTTPPYTSIADLIGNAAEWQDNGCASGQCLTLGASYLDLEPSCFDGVDLEAPLTLSIQSFESFVGFRCCYYP